MARQSSHSSPTLIATCTVSFEGFGECNGVHSRLNLLRRSAARAAKGGVQLVCFPGGYLFCRTDLEVLKLRKQLEHVSKDLGVTIAVGVDRAKKSIMNAEDKEILEKKLTKLIRTYQLPWFAVCAYPDGTSDLWRQRSINSKNQYDAPTACCSEFRGVRGMSPQTEILMCGEIFNARIRAEIISRGIQLVIDLGHYAHGFRVHAAMKVLASQGVTSLCSVHADKVNATKYCYGPNSKGYTARSTIGSDFTIGRRPRVEMKVWNLGTFHRSAGGGA